ncbi:MAG: glycine cleavage system aminomethyltransferase GcvT [Pseudomonadota bacterium]
MSEDHPSGDERAALKRTPLHALHCASGAKMTPFAGYDMPVQFAPGVLKEHLQTRARAGLFDVSHMGQVRLTTREADAGAPDAHEAVADAIETVVPGDVRKLKAGRLRYSVLLNDDGGIVDDLMITRPADPDAAGVLFLVVNASRKDVDVALLREKIGDRVDIDLADDRALIALQGPAAAAVVETAFPGAARQTFMTMRTAAWDGADVSVSRCGYTGEDGFEISLPAEKATAFAEMACAHPDVEPIGLGARDSLRLEAGLCLYGSDLDETVSPVEADLGFAIGKRRRTEGGFAGAARIAKELADGTARKRVCIKPEGRAPARAGAEIASADGASVGRVTSGGFGPSVGGPVAMGYVDAAHAAVGTPLTLTVRGKALPATVVESPFVPHRYYRG